MVTPGTPKLVWVKALKNSARNCAVTHAPGPAISIRLVSTEWQPPHARQNEALRHIELRSAVLEASVLTILRLFEFPDVDAVAGAAGGKVVHRIRQRLAVGVGGQQRESL